MGGQDFVRIYSTASITDGYLAKGRLEAEGIPVLLKGEGEGPYRMGPVHVWVPDGVEVQARMILDAIHRDAPDHGAFDDEIADEAADDEFPDQDMVVDDAVDDP